MDGDGIFLGEHHGADLQHLGAGAGQLEHLVVGDARQFSRVRADAGVGGKNPFDIRVDLAGGGIEKRRQRHRAGVRAAAPQSRNVVVLIDALEPRHHDDLALVQSFDNLLRVDVSDMRLAIGVVSLDPDLMPE
jgi:hypothetical protein